MDGVKGRMSHSIRLRLSVWLSVVIVGVAVAAGLFSFTNAYEEALRLQDAMLLQVAGLVDRQELMGAIGPSSNQASPDDEDDLRVTVHLLGRDIVVPHDGDPEEALLHLPADLGDGVHTLKAGDDSFRVLAKTLASGQRIAVVQETDMRDEIAEHGAMRTVMPLLILVPILLALVSQLTARMFRPIVAAAEEIDRRSEASLHPVAEDPLPSEVRPFALAINRLLARVGQSMEAQRRFVADAAHELRSPLTALSLQAQRLEIAQTSEDGRQRLAELRQGIDRGRALVEQLLALARAQASPDGQVVALSVRDVYRQVVEDLLPLAIDRRIDLGVEGDEDAQVRAKEVELFSLIRNLVDNAIRYTPMGGRVDLSVSMDEKGLVRVWVTDTGPGIPEEDWVRVFDPFYRVLGTEVMGSGLGLSIVKTLASGMGASVRLMYADAEAAKGLRVEVLFGANPRAVDSSPA